MILKCKMCGGYLNIVEGASTAECEYCGSVQTVPKADNEKKLTLFGRANRLRASCEFDKAAGVYESIVADFPEEAEAYWGLVLCKYGIEYVDDPASSKKIPTCHRSSFSSIMEDADFEQALENADVIARKVYREEAKAIEEIRKGIVAVSANEQPYDIFICYKEIDEKGERTLDSVLAQDVYDALTGKGYRVFFSRISLEDKLGTEYEPYIFAALNSAKLMLAFGTDYEYFNAVWVKNEWSRYLKLMAADKSKHLIPCYKGIDAYDMPKEFARLQAQDMGKVGAMQDLLRGIEKMLPREKEKALTVMQERVIVNRGADNRIASLLGRGFMALEDGDFAKADGFFEKVLDDDFKEARAYLGKALVVEKCRTLDALVEKKQDSHRYARGKELQLPPNEAHIAEMVERYAIPDYLPEIEIRKLYVYDLSYHSDVEERTIQSHAMKDLWTNHKWLSKAEKFATGTCAEELAKARNVLFKTLDDRVVKAQEAEARARVYLQKRYEAHLKQTDAKVEVMHKDALSRVESRYQELLIIARSSRDEKKLLRTGDGFDWLKDYKDSKALAEQCRKRAAKEAKQQLKRKRKKASILVTILCVIVAAACLIYFIVIPTMKYNKATALINEGKFDEAIAVFEELNGFKDSVQQIEVCTYSLVEKLQAEGNLPGAAIAFAQMGDYQDARARGMKLWNEIAQQENLSAGYFHTAGLKADGSVVAAGWNEDGQCDVSSWSDVMAVSAGYRHTVGLRADGSVLAVGNNGYGQCDVSGWSDVVAVSVGEYHTVGLKADGSVLAVGRNKNGRCDVSDWRDIVAISAGSTHTVGLKVDGSVLAVGYNDDGQCNTSSWRGVIAVSSGRWHTVGLRADGSVLTVGANEDGQCDVSSWSDIVAVSAGGRHTVGLKVDGSVVAAGGNEDGQCNVSDWSNIVAVSAGANYTVGLKADGSVVAVGYNNHGQCNVSDWSGIKLPE